MSTEVIRTYYDKEQTKLDEEYFILNGKKEGEYKSYHENGKIFEFGNYINGKNINVRYFDSEGYEWNSKNFDRLIYRRK